MRCAARIIGATLIFSAVLFGYPSAASSAEGKAKNAPVSLEDGSKSKAISTGQVDFRSGVTHRATIHDSLPEYRFILSADSEYNTVRRAEVVRGDSNTAIQSLNVSPDATQPFYAGEDYFVVEDVNFDGYKDVRLLSGYGGTGNRYFRFWLFDPARGLFVFNQAMDEMCSPTVDPVAKMIRSHYNGGNAGCLYSDSIYQFDSQGVCIETRRVVQDLDPAQKCFLTTTFERKDGVMQQVSVEASSTCECR